MVGKASTSGATGAAAKAHAKEDKAPEELVAAAAAAEEDHIIRTGTFSFSDGAKYIGEYVSHGGKLVRHGRGVYVNGPESYDGEWEHDQMHGKGVYTFATGARYEGDFLANVFHGIGTYYWADGATYTGGWAYQRMQGEGKYVDPAGVEWQGRFFNGKYDNGRIFHTLR